MRLALLGIFAVAALTYSEPAFAHHSLASEFDESKPMTLHGVITKIDWVNPHVYVYMTVKNNGKTEEWSLETLPPVMLRKGGLRKDMLGAGEMVTVLTYQARSGANLGFLRKITFGDGHEVVVWIGDVKSAQ